MLRGHVSNEVDLSSHAELLEYWAERIDPGASLQASEVRRDGQIGYDTRSV
jgi:hypothetical protein